MLKSKRKFLISGLQVWATPVISSVMLPAHAQTSQPMIAQGVYSLFEEFAGGSVTQCVIVENNGDIKYLSEIINIENQITTIRRSAGEANVIKDGVNNHTPHVPVKVSKCVDPQSILTLLVQQFNESEVEVSNSFACCAEGRRRLPRAECSLTFADC